MAYRALSCVALGKGVVMGHRDSGVGHLQRVGEKVQPGASKWGLQSGERPLGIALRPTNPRVLSLHNRDGQSGPQLLQCTELLLLHLGDGDIVCHTQDMNSFTGCPSWG